MSERSPQGLWRPADHWSASGRGKYLSLPRQPHQKGEMANSWLRLWHEMPNDPKWRTISRVAEEPIPSVLSVYVHLLVSASLSSPRGQINVNPEDVASALGIETVSVQAIIAAMQGRVLDGNLLTGWERRQPAREDNSTDRVKQYRKRNATQCNAPSVSETHYCVSSESNLVSSGYIDPVTQCNPFQKNQ